MAVKFCDIGWLNVSVGLCVFCSSVFFCEKENAPFMWEWTLEIRWGVPSLTKDISFSHRTHRTSRTFLRTVSISQNASGIQRTQNVIAIVDINKVQHEAYILLIGVSRWLRPSLWGRGRGRGQLGKGEGPLFFWPLCVLFICVFLWEIERTLWMSKTLNIQ